MLKPKGQIPHQPPARHVTCGAYRIGYFTTGPENGRPLVLCHGLAASGLQFVADAHFFAARGFRVIVPDLRGHGRSDSTHVHQDKDFSIANLATDMIAILDREKINSTDWVGNSLGGIVALDIMGSDPKRLKRFASFGTAYRLDVPKAVVPFMQLSYNTMGREILARLGAPLTCRDPHAQAVIYTMLASVDVDAVIRTARHVRCYDLIAKALSFDKPILMIRGNLDRAVNRALGPTLKAMQDQKNFSLIDISGAGHCANLDRPDQVRTAVLDFLTRS